MAAENDEVGIAKYYIDKLLDDCLINLEAKEYQFYLTGSTNFRFQIYPEYKANRLGTPKPKHLSAMREYLMTNHNAIMSDGCEADDLMGVNQDKVGRYTTIVSLDKDMLMIPGWHYSWHIEGGPADKRWVREAKLQYVDELQGLKWFYTQMLTGDSSDNIKGVTGIGKVRAEKMLNGDLTANEMFNIVRDAYSNDDAMEMNAQVLWIWQEMNDIWEWPFEIQKDI